MTMETRTIAKVSEETASLGYREAEILNLVKERPSLPLDEVSPYLREVRSLISSRHLALLVVEYPWGVEFELALSKKGADYLGRALPVDGASPSQEERKA
jgi:hypothetical protein